MARLFLSLKQKHSNWTARQKYKSDFGNNQHEKVKSVHNIQKE